MDPKVKEFIEAAKVKERTRFEKERDAHLISLGLIKERLKEYSEAYNPSKYPSYDSSMGKYYRETIIPIDVTDEEYEEIRKITKIVPSKESDIEIKKGVAESFLGTINGISLAIGIIATLVLIIVSIVEGEGWLFLIALVVFFLSVTSWSIPKIILNISNNIREINSKLK